MEIIEKNNIERAKAILLNKIEDLQTAFDLLKGYNVKISELANLATMPEKRLKLVLIKKKLGGKTPTIGGLPVAIELFADYAKIDNLAEIMFALSKITEQTREYICYVINNGGALSIDETTLEADNTLKANEQQTKICKIAEAVADLLTDYERITHRVLKGDCTDLEQLIKYENGKTKANYNYILKNFH